MRSVLLRLAGPLQSWGTQGRFWIRDTDREPSKSGILGLVGAAMGMPRGDTQLLERLGGMRLAVRVDREGAPLRDYHTAGGAHSPGAGGIWSMDRGRRIPDPAVTIRYYLCDASFLAALGTTDEDLLSRVARALQDPVWPLFLGRRSCPPCEPVFAGKVAADPETALRQAPLAKVDATAPDRVRFVLEDPSGEGALRPDDPRSFALYARRHAQRCVRVVYVDRNTLPTSS